MDENVLKYPVLQVYSESDIKKVREAALKILEEVGIRIENKSVLDIVGSYSGVTVNPLEMTVNLSPDFVLECIKKSPKKYSIFGRDGTKEVRYGSGNMILKSTAGDPYLADLEKGVLRKASVKDVNEATDIADKLENINIVGGLHEPHEVGPDIRPVKMLAEIIKRTCKPPRVWVSNKKSARYIVKILQTVTGGEAALIKKPVTHHSLEPISPLRYSTGLEAAKIFAKAGLPIIIGPIVQCMATGPCSLAGSSALCVAEGLAGVVIVQCLQPGLPVSMAASAHPLDPAKMTTVYGSPEQGLLAAATVQVIKSFGMPAYANAGYCDSKTPDMQMGIEKSTTMLMSALTGADSFAHMGSVGILGASSLQLIMDNEMVGFIKRIKEGINVNENTLALDVIKRVGIGGHYITDQHTIENWRKEFWMPNSLFDRSMAQAWEEEGSKNIMERAIEIKDRILKGHEPDLMDKKMADEIDDIVTEAQKEV